MAQREFMNKNLQYTFQFFDIILESSQMWDSTSSNIVENKSSTFERGKYVLKDDDD